MNLDHLYFMVYSKHRHTGWKFAGTARSGGGGVVVEKVCLVVADVVVALDELHSHCTFHDNGS